MSLEHRHGVWAVADNVPDWWDCERELLDIALHSMARVWGKEQDQDNPRREYKQFVEMGDILFHATNGAQGACGGYDGPPCKEGES